MPQTHAFVISNEQAVILVFRGTEPTNLIQWATDATAREISPISPFVDNRNAPMVQQLLHLVKKMLKNSGDLWADLRVFPRIVGTACAMESHSDCGCLYPKSNIKIISKRLLHTSAIPHRPFWSAHGSRALLACSAMSISLLHTMLTMLMYRSCIIVLCDEILKLIQFFGKSWIAQMHLHAMTLRSTCVCMA